MHRGLLATGGGNGIGSSGDGSGLSVIVTRVDLKGTFAFVHLRGKRISEAVRRSNGMYWHGNRLTVELAKSNEIRKWNDRKSYHPNKTLFVVVNCEVAHISEDDIGHLFGKYGNIARVSLRRYAVSILAQTNCSTKKKENVFRQHTHKHKKECFERMHFVYAKDKTHMYIRF